MNKPELLLPAGNEETFVASIEGGADAVYLGLKDFNARGRAKNFTYGQLKSVLNYAHSKNRKVYVTLNTVIKNNEISQLIDTLHILNQLKPDAVIIQDWGVWYIIKTFFPNLSVHASTQMAIHNSMGANYAKTKGFDRVILARELTLNELKLISERTKVELEMFVHGALCYSFSGLCLFSSFVGGQGANRGLCKQPCRRLFHSNSGTNHPFSLKDLQLIELIPELSKIRIASLKVEGRLKSVNYVNKVAKAYKMVINDPTKVSEAIELLNMDLSREKTGYFVSGKVTDSITQQTASGKIIGKVIEVGDKIKFSSNIELKKGDRLRVIHKDGSQNAFKINEFLFENTFYTIDNNRKYPFKKEEVLLLASQKELKFKLESSKSDSFKINHVSPKQIKVIQKQIRNNRLSVNKRMTLFIRVNNIDWVRKLHFEDFDGVFFQLPIKQWAEFRLETPFVKKNINKIIVELPAFIPEADVDSWKQLLNKLAKNRVAKVSLSHISHQFIVPKGVSIIFNENIYAFNDAAITAFKKQGITHFIYPLENDLENFKAYANKSGIISMYFKPKLFYSRMPVNIGQDEVFKDDYGYTLQHTKVNGITNITPVDPVAYTQYAKSLKSLGYNNFLIDMSFEYPSKNRVKTIIKRLFNSEQIQPSSNFNFKDGLI